MTASLPPWGLGQNNQRRPVHCAASVCSIHVERTGRRRRALIILPLFVLLAFSGGDTHAESGQATKTNVSVRLNFRITIPSFLRLSYELNDQTKLQVAAVTGRATPVILSTGATQTLRFAGGGHHSLFIDLPAVAFCYDPEDGGDQTVIYTLSSP